MMHADHLNDPNRNLYRRAEQARKALTTLGYQEDKALTRLDEYRQQADSLTGTLAADIAEAQQDILQAGINANRAELLKAVRRHSELTEAATTLKQTAIIQGRRAREANVILDCATSLREQIIDQFNDAGQDFTNAYRDGLRARPIDLRHVLSTEDSEKHWKTLSIATTTLNAAAVVLDVLDNANPKRPRSRYGRNLATNTEWNEADHKHAWLTDPQLTNMQEWLRIVLATPRGSKPTVIGYDPVLSNTDPVSMQQMLNDYIDISPADHRYVQSWAPTWWKANEAGGISRYGTSDTHRGIRITT